MERLHRAAARANALQQITEELARPIEYIEVVEAIVRASVHALGARAGAVFEWEPEPPSFRLACAFNHSPDILSQLDRIPADDRALEAAGVQNGEPIVFETHAVFQRSFPRLAAIGAEVETRILLPLRATHDLIGILALSLGVERGVSPNERAFARAIARQCSLALERARLYQGEQQARAVAESAIAALESLADVGCIRAEKFFGPGGNH